MRLRRPRMTIRFMMCLILIVALLLGGKMWAVRHGEARRTLSTDREETCGTLEQELP